MPQRTNEFQKLVYLAKLYWTGAHGVEEFDFLDKDGNEIFLAKLEPRMLRKIVALEVQGKCRFDRSRFPLRHAAPGEIEVSWGKGEVSGRDTMLVVSPDKAGDAKLTISFGPEKQ